VVLVFDVSADIAMFRKPYTTTSMVSYPFPPPTAVAGLIGAIVGLDHQAWKHAESAAYWAELKDVQVAVGIRSPLRWVVTAVNLMKFKTGNADMTEHVQIKHQFVKKPTYRIYVRGGAVYETLKKYLQAGEFVYTPSLGTAYALADIRYIGEFSENAVEERSLALDTVVPYGQGVRIDVLASGDIHRETVPVQFDTMRTLRETSVVFYPDFPRRAKVPPRIILAERGSVSISQVGEEKVAWFHGW